MTNLIQTQKTYIVAIFLAISLVVLSLPMLASAATYAYVDVAGEVKAVTADTWMAAINTAPNIHMHSGVLSLKGASDFDIVGDDVKSI